MDARSDDALIAAWRAGDQEAFAALVARHHGLVKAACARQAPLAEVDDCVQAVFLVLVRRPAAAARTRVLAAWLLRVAWFVCRRAQRSAQRRQRAERGAASAVAPRAAAPVEVLALLDECLNRLPERQRDALSLHFLAGRSAEEVAADLGISRDNAYQLVSRGLAALRALLARRGVAIGTTALTALSAAQVQAATAATTSAAVVTTLTLPSATAAHLATGTIAAMKTAVLIPYAAVLAVAAGTTTLVVAAEVPSAPLEIHVATTGDDAATGTAAAPLKSLAAAQQAVRAALARAPGRGATVLIHQGVHYLPATVVFTSADSGTKTAPVTWAAAGDGEVVISGGMRLTLRWEAWRDGILKATVPAGLELDQLFVDGKRQPMARYPNFDATVHHFNGSAADAFSPARAARWKDPTGGYIHAMHKHEWGDYHYRITGKDAANTVTYEGGWQNNRQMGMHDKYRMVENILEELDAPGEWFLDGRQATLYYLPAPGVDAANAVVEGVRLRHLWEFRGDQRAPVRWVALKGLTFRHAARTFMDNKEPLVRSDWTTYRGGALFFAGAEDCAVQDCTIDQVGGNAVFVSDYNRRITVSGCRIEQAGANGVAFVGNPRMARNPLFEYNQTLPVEKLDLTPGPLGDDYPADCLVDDCLIHATGRVEKQTAPVQIELAARITVRDCTIHAVPRAGINIGDGCWGGHVIEGCDVFDTVLETGDHGSFNSWGRDRFWVPGIKAIDQRVAAHPELPLLDVVEPNTLRNSRWRCDHGWDIDLDDGSSNYRIYNNLCLNGGLKLREGFQRVVENNVIVGNSLHPHVWCQPSHDHVQRNIVGAAYRPINVPKPWGDACDGNLLHKPGQEAVPARGLREQSGRDEASLEGDAHFIAPEKGDYRVADGSPALKLGFVNFPMDHYGVRSPRLRALAGQPLLPGQGKGAGTPSATDPAGSRDPALLDWLGARIKNLTGLGEVSATGMSGETGIFLTEVAEAGFAARQGLQKLDVILSVDGRAVATVHDLLRAYATTTAGTPVRLGLRRNQQDTTVAIAGGQALLLSPGTAAMQGDGPKPVFDAHKEYCGSWGNAGASLHWEAALPAGIWDVAVLVAAPGGGSTYTLTAAGHALDGVVPDTGAWEAFTARSVGVITVAAAGPLPVDLRPVSRKGQGVMNLRGLVLTRR